MPPLRIEIAVGGRFHADHMTQSLVAAGHDVRLLTSLPASRFPAIARERITSFLIPEIVFRLAIKAGLPLWGERFKVNQFAQQVARYRRHRQPVDIFLSWSSFALESFQLGGPE